MRDLLIRTGRLLYGERWQSPLAADLGVSDRTMRRWVAGAEPPDLKADLRALAESRRDGLTKIVEALR